jgi:hypothetical protein
MGWQDAPVVEAKSAWESAPEVDAPKKEKNSDPLRQAALTGRAAVEGAFGHNPLLDLQTAPIRYAAKALGVNIPDSGEMVKAGLDKLGAYTPETSGERIGSDVTKGAVGALSGGGALKSAIGALASGAAAGGAAGGVREAGGNGLWQMLAGLAGGLAVPAAGAAASGLANKAVDIGATVGAGMGNKASIEKLARDAANKISGSERDFIKAAESAATKYVDAPVTTAEAIAQRNQLTQDVRAGATARLQKDLSGASGAEDILPSVAKQQKSAMATIIDKLAGGTGREAQDLAQKQAEMARNAETAPMREQALKNANVAGVLAPKLEGEAARLGEAAAAKVEDVRRMNAAAGRAEDMGVEFGRRSPATRLGSATGMPSAGGRNSYGNELAARAESIAEKSAADSLPLGEAARFAKMQADSLATSGHFPLESKSITAKLDETLATPGIRASDVVEKTLGAVRSKIAEFTNKDGVIDSRDLYTIRKEIGNTIQTYAKETSNWDKRLTARLETDVKKYIDSAIEGAGGSGWKDYLSTYGSMSKDVDRLKVAQALSDKLRNEKGDLTSTSFLNVLGRGEDALLKTKSGQPRDTSIESLFGKDAESIRAIGEHLTRQELANKIAGDVKGSGASSLAAGEIPKIPNLLNRTAMVTNFMLKHMGAGANEPVARLVAEKMAQGRYSDLLTKPASDPSRKVAEAILRASTATAATQ